LYDARSFPLRADYTQSNDCQYRSPAGQTTSPAVSFYDFRPMKFGAISSHSSLARMQSPANLPVILHI